MVDIFEFPIVISVKIQQCIPKRQNYKILNSLHAVARENDYTLSWAFYVAGDTKIF